ncbi:CPBP family intramembrane metalloprotease [Listeria seeligeri]|nr:CPBP family intramembrane metalloprotease [Listeria seeligeri]MBC1583414.1 CPBP family intramembrane metalloprotease [Listeria seeligeri]MBC1773431.1 CPBP family intramembrane metalloprotease [Listeria seeligeri]MBC1864836.1 CPBP family intramembrane metalloprotease [Listeria seeligeri]MBC1868434.1 CPBP family intramembrane metalloprotease [Listeria seeligeri]
MHNLLFLLTLFPGMLLLLTKWMPLLKRKSTFFQYLISLGVVTFIECLFFRQSIGMILSIISVLILPFVLFFIEYVLIERQFKKLIYISKKNKIIIQSVIYFPILEEFIFRYFIFQYCILFGFNDIQFILLSTLAFVLAHVFYQGVTSVVKVIFSVVLGIIFLLTLNVFVTIIIHCIFNFLIYIVRNSKYNNYYNT